MNNKKQIKAAKSLLVRALLVFLCGGAVVLTGDRTSGIVYGADKKSDEAQRLMRRGEYEGAEKIYREMLAKDTRSLRARLGLGAALLKQRKVQDAFDQAARATTIDPTSARAHALLGTTLLTGGNFSLSVEEFKFALSLNGDEAMAIAGLAMVDFYENRSRASLAGLRRAVFLDATEPDYLFNLAQSAARSERYREAADAYERFLAIAPISDADRRARIRGLIDFLRYLGDQRPLYRTNTPSLVVLPFEPTGGRPIIKVRINNSKEEFRFVIDTGSGMSVISDHTAKVLNLRPAAHGGMARAVGGGGRFEIIYAFLPSIQLGAATVENVPVYVRRFYNDQETIDGYIGLSLLSKFVTAIDYGTRNILLARSSDDIPALEPTTAAATQVDTPTPKTTAPAVGSATNEPVALATNLEIPVRLTSSGFLSSEVQLDGISAPLNFILDTGASISVVSEALATREEIGRFMQKTKMRVFGAAGIVDNVTAVILPRIALGKHARSGLSAVILDLEPINETTGFEQTGIIGGNFLKNFRVVIDFQRAVVRLEPLGSPSSPTPPARVTQQDARNGKQH